MPDYMALASCSISGGLTMAKKKSTKDSIKDLYTDYQQRSEKLDQLLELGESRESVNLKKQEMAKSFLKSIDTKLSGEKNLDKTEKKMLEIASISRAHGGYETTDFRSAMEGINLLAEGVKEVRENYTIKRTADEVVQATPPPKRYERGDYVADFEKRRAAAPPKQHHGGGLLSAARDFAGEARELNDRKSQPDAVYIISLLISDTTGVD